jgi:CHAT domain-containing protein
MKPALFFFILWLCGATLPFTIQAQTWQEAFQQGWTLYQAERYQEAPPFLEKSLQLLEKEASPDATDLAVLTYLLASGYEKMQQTGKALLKQIKQPFILHIATHGFFLPVEQMQAFRFMQWGDAPGQSIIQNPLYRTGLLLAGAENTLRGDTGGEAENGILFAAEVQELPLLGCQLVVLSACETGLGELQNGEGVYGLQRAFMEAGAEAVIMSLWRVDDQATQKLMQLFYSFYIREKQDKAGAFRRAIQTLKKDYPHPYYWGAFVLIEN